MREIHTSFIIQYPRFFVNKFRVNKKFLAERFVEF